MINYVIILLVVLTLAVGQVLFKIVGLRINESGPTSILSDYRTMTVFFVSLCLYGVATLGWIWGLRQVPLSTAYLFMSLGFVLVPMAAWYLFSEPISYRYIIGAGMIVVGIIISAS